MIYKVCAKISYDLKWAFSPLAAHWKHQHPGHQNSGDGSRVERKPQRAAFCCNVYLGLGLGEGWAGPLASEDPPLLCLEQLAPHGRDVEPKAGGEGGFEELFGE